MNYIVLDLEWNQPVSYASAAYRKVGSKLLFEVIQIGAAKVDETMQIVDSISIPICPTHYLTIHPRVKRMTGLTQETRLLFPRAWSSLWTGAETTASA